MLMKKQFIRILVESQNYNLGCDAVYPDKFTDVRSKINYKRNILHLILFSSDTEVAVYSKIPSVKLSISKHCLRNK